MPHRRRVVQSVPKNVRYDIMPYPADYTLKGLYENGKLGSYLFQIYSATMSGPKPRRVGSLNPYFLVRRLRQW